MVSAQKNSVRDLFGLALHKTIQEVHGQAATDMIRHISPILQKGLGTKTEDVQELCLDIVALLFKQFSGLLSKREDLVKR